MSDKSFYSGDWYRVAGLRPRLRLNAGIHRQEFRGGLWYVLQDRVSGRFYRFSPEAWLVISLFDGKRSVAEIWDLACGRLGDDVLTQSEIIGLLSQLHQANVLQGDVMPNVDEMLHRAEKQERRKRILSFANPLAMRLPLIDPDNFLSATMPLVRPLFGWLGALLFLGLLGYALVLAGIYWSALTENIADRVLVGDSIVLLILTYPFVKALHELGHGYAVKRWGGEVHEIGIMFLVFMPVPYVDASAASEFREKHRRAIVGAAGILVELFLASLAMLVWVQIEEGLTRAFAFNIMLIGGVSTLLFNGNPLLRFDGYYILADLIEIPNLDLRSKSYVAYLVKRYLFGIENVDNPATAPGEPKWLFTYAIAAFFYRLFIIAAIVIFVAASFHLIGAVLAIWSVIMMFGVPLVKRGWFLLTSPTLRRRRGRALMVTAGTIGTVVAAITLVPLPYATLAEGVVWTSQEAAVYAGGSGHVSALSTEPNGGVTAGAELLRLDDPVLVARFVALEAKAIELRYRVAAVAFDQPAEAKVVRARLKKAEEDLADARIALTDLEVRSPATGRFVLPEGDDVIGRYYDKGELIGYVADFTDPVLVVVVPEESADLVRTGTTAVEFRFTDDMARVWPARVRREVPEITDRLPTAALATIGGGALSVDPDSPGGLRSLNKVLQLELEFDRSIEVPGLGGRVHVIFRHEDQAIAVRAWRALRQLFLREFNV